MPKYILSYAIVALLILTPAGMLFLDSQWDEKVEHRKAQTAFPELPKKIRNKAIKRYFTEIDKYIADTIPFRGKLISFAWDFFENADLNQDMNIALRGKDNWLFLGNNYNGILDKLQNKIVLQEDSLKNAVELYGAMHLFAKERKADFALLIGPNKSSVYGEYLPPTISRGKTRYLSPALKELREKGLLVVDPTALLIESKKKGLMYYRTDTHWNLLGASIAASALFKRLALPAPQNYSLLPGPPLKGDIVAIAGYSTFPLAEGDNFLLEWEPQFNVLINEDGNTREIPGAAILDSAHRKRISVFNKNAATDKTVWVYTDSFGAALSPFLNATFKEAHYLPHGDFGPGKAEPGGSSPDVIITIVVERNFLH